MPSGLLRAGREAVSVASGGIVLKSDLPFASESGRWDSGHWSEPRLCVDDPLTGAPCAGTRAAEDAPSEPARRLRGLGPCPHLCLLAPGVSRLHALLRPLVLLVAAAGRDVSAGSYRISDVQLAFSKAARRLEALARGRRLTDTRCNYLEGLFDVQVARAPRSWLAVALHALRVHCCPGRQLLPGMDGPSNGGMLAPVCAKWWLPPPPLLQRATRRVYDDDGNEFYQVTRKPNGQQRGRDGKWSDAPGEQPSQLLLLLLGLRWRTQAAGMQPAGGQAASHSPHPPRASCCWGRRGASGRPHQQQLRRSAGGVAGRAGQQLGDGCAVWR